MSLRKFSIMLPQELADAIVSRVETGQYASTDKAMQAAVDALLREDAEQDERLAAIRNRVKRSLDDPRPSISGNEARAHLDRLYTSHKG